MLSKGNTKTICSGNAKEFKYIFNFNRTVTVICRRSFCKPFATSFLAPDKTVSREIFSHETSLHFVFIKFIGLSLIFYSAYKIALDLYLLILNFAAHAEYVIVLLLFVFLLSQKKLKMLEPFTRQRNNQVAVML